MAVLKYKDSNGQWQTLPNVMVNQINVVQTTGSSSADVMSQSAVTEAINSKQDSFWVSGTGENSVVLKNSSGIASGSYAVAEGYKTSATSDSSHAEGNNTVASGDSSHAEGNSTIANNNSEHASGQYNVSSKASATFGNSGNTLFSVGNGSAENARHNAFEIRQNGDIYIINKEGDDVKLQDEIGNITIDQVIDSGTSASTDAVSTSAVYGFVTSYTPSITVDQVLDSTTSASTNPVSSKAVYDAVTDNELVWTNAYVTLSGVVSSHTADNNVHLTQTEKTNIDSLATNIATISGITSTNVTNWNGASTNSHTHSNKSTLDGITSTNVTNWNGASTNSHTHSNRSALDAITGNVGTMAYENANSYSSATEVNTALGNKADKADTVVSAVTVSSDLSNVTCPNSITGSSKSGAQAIVIYENGGTTTDYTITVSTNYKSPDGSQISITCAKGGYCEVNYVNVNGTIYARGA